MYFQPEDTQFELPFRNLAAFSKRRAVRGTIDRNKKYETETRINITLREIKRSVQPIVYKIDVISLVKEAAFFIRRGYTRIISFQVRLLSSRFTRRYQTGSHFPESRGATLRSSLRRSTALAPHDGAAPTGGGSCSVPRTCSAAHLRAQDRSTSGS